LESTVNKTYYPGLTSLRAVAALMVYLHHFNPLTKGTTFLGIPVWGIINEFHIGVTIFFVLSGFLIASRYMDNKISFKKYLWNRFVRIYPIYFILTLLTFVLKGVNTEYSYRLWTLFILNITFLRGFIESTKFSLVAQGWSLTVEETFYFLAPLIFLLFRRYGIVVYFTPVLLILAGLVLSKMFNNSALYGGGDFFMNYTFFGRSTEFFVGIFLAQIVKEYNKSELFKWIRPIQGVMFGVLLVWVLHFISVYFDYDFGIRSYFGMIVNTLLIPIFVVAPIIISYTIRNKNSSLFESNFMQVLGKSSYVFYLIHVGIVRDFLGYMGISNEIGLLVSLLFLSFLIWRFIEEPIHSRLKTLTH
jgi:peptidoglycan/LPS O-acetylase OafA/YrhL